MAKALALKLAGLLAVVAVVAGCGGGENAGGGTGGNAADPAPENAQKDPPKDNTPKADPDAWRKIAGTEPEGWSKLGKTGYEELQNAKYSIIRKPKADHVLLASVASMHAPHATSGTDAEWQAFRDQASAALLYSVSKKSEDAAEVLRRMGGEFIDNFDTGAVKPDGNIATCVNAERMLVALSLANGTYIVTAIARDADAQKAVIAWAKSFKPQ